MRKRLEVATALFPNIRILILDEPTTGLDPSARRDFFSLVGRISSREASILLVTHIGTDAELASRVGLIDRGKIIAEGTPEALKGAYATGDVVTIETPIRSEAVVGLLRGYSNEGRVLETPTGYRIYSRDGNEAVPGISRSLDQAGCPASRIEVTRPTLEDVFFRLTSRSVQEGTPL